MDIVVACLRFDLFLNIRNTGLRIYHGVTVAVLVQVVHDGVFSDSDGLIRQAVSDLVKIAADKFIDRACTSSFIRINGKITLVLLINVYHVSVFVKTIQRIRFIVSFRAVYFVHFGSISQSNGCVFIIGSHMKVIQAVKQDRGVLAFDGFCDPYAVAGVIDLVLVVVVIVHYFTSTVDLDLASILFLKDVHSLVSGMSLIHVNTGDVIGTGVADNSYAGETIIFPIVFPVPGYFRITEDLHGIIQCHFGTGNVAVGIVCGFQCPCYIGIAFEHALGIIHDLHGLIEPLCLPVHEIFQGTLEPSVTQIGIV